MAIPWPYHGFIMAISMQLAYLPYTGKALRLRRDHTDLIWQ